MVMVWVPEVPPGPHPLKRQIDICFPSLLQHTHTMCTRLWLPYTHNRPPAYYSVQQYPPKASQVKMWAPIVPHMRVTDS